MRKLLLAAVAASLLLSGAVVATPPVRALDNGLALTPYMGWNTYYGLGTRFNESTVLAEADTIVSRGLKAAGYKYVWIDGGWWQGTRDGTGTITVSSTQWPDGMAYVASYIHSLGLKAGIYTDAGQQGCGGVNEGSYGHYQQDADTFAAWGYDAVKVDFCGGNKMGLDPAVAYGQFRDALLNNSSHRPMLFNICNPFYPGELGPNDPTFADSAYNSYSFGPATANSWRTDTDIGFAHSIAFSDVLRNLDADAMHPEAAGPGHWNDPDYLGPELGMTAAEFRAQLSMWAVVAAPLIIGSDVRALSNGAVADLENPDVLAISQDPNGVQGTRISQQGAGDVWVKPLANGDRAVALLNRGGTPVTISTTASAIGLPNAGMYVLNDLWAHTTSESGGTISATVPADSVVLYRVSAQASQSTPPSVVLSNPSINATASSVVGPVLAPGAPARASVTFTDTGRVPVENVQLTLDAPSGWTVAPATQTSPAVDPGGSVAATWTVTAPAGTLPGTDHLAISATYDWRTAGGTSHTSVNGSLDVIVPYEPPTGSAYLSDQPWLDASSGWQYATRDASVANGGPITMQGVTYPKGIGVASPSTVEFFLGGQCSRLTATVGIDDIVNRVSSQGGTATFSILADGKTVYQSGVVDRTATRSVDVDLSAAQVVSLVVGDAGDGGYNDRADWAGLQVTCSSSLATVPNGPWPHFVPQSGLTATATSNHPGYLPAYAVDGKLTTFWHSEWSPYAPLPQSITIDMGATDQVDGLVYQARADGGTSGIVTGYTISVSSDGSTFTNVASGTWPSDTSVRSASWSTVTARYVRVTATSGIGGYASAAELDVSNVP